MTGLPEGLLTLSHDQLSNETFLVCPQSQQMFLNKQISLTDANELREIVESLSEQQHLNHEHLLSLRAIELDNIIREGVVFHRISVFYEYGGYTLAEEVLARCSQQRYFHEYQIWNVLSSVTLALEYMLKAGISYGGLSSQDIFLTPTGQVKLADPSLSTISPYEYAEGHYHPPQVLEWFKGVSQCQRDSRHTKTESVGFKGPIDLQACDVFSLGLIMLELCRLKPCTDFFYGFDFNVEILEQELVDAAENYSQELVTLITEMLQPNKALRCRIKSLYQRLIEQFPRELKKDQLEMSGFQRSDQDLPSAAFPAILKDKATRDYADGQEEDHSMSRSSQASPKSSNISFACLDGLEKSIRSRILHMSNKQNVSNNNNSFQDFSAHVLKDISSNIQRDVSEVKVKAHTKHPETCISPFDDNSTLTRTNLSIFEAKPEIRTPSVDGYTNPEFLKMLARDVQKILSKKTQSQSKVSLQQK